MYNGSLATILFNIQSYIKHKYTKYLYTNKFQKRIYSLNIS